MEIHELIVEMKLLERRLTLYEEKYGVLSEDFQPPLWKASCHNTTLMMRPASILANGKEFMKHG